jgi:hypothetical protein
MAARAEGRWRWDGGNQGGEASGWNYGDAVMREIPQECSTADGNAHFADADANTAGGATIAVFSSFCRWAPGCRYCWSQSNDDNNVRAHP